MYKGFLYMWNIYYMCTNFIYRFTLYICHTLYLLTWWCFLLIRTFICMCTCLYGYMCVWVLVCLGTCLHVYYVGMCTCLFGYLFIWVFSIYLFVRMSSYLYGYLCVWGTCLYGYSIQQLVSQMWSFHFWKHLINVYLTQMSKLS